MVFFRFETTVKAEWFGKTVLKINQWPPSTKTCNICEYKHPNMNESLTEWQCPVCKTYHDRDINAAINIKNFALAEREEGLGDSFPKGKGMNQEVPMLWRGVVHACGSKRKFGEYWKKYLEIISGFTDKKPLFLQFLTFICNG
jgi:transposase